MTAHQPPLPERIEEILEKAALSYDHKDCDPTECAGHSRYKDATHQINALLNEARIEELEKVALTGVWEDMEVIWFGDNGEELTLEDRIKQLNKEK
jgi:hypothetical protein